MEEDAPRSARIHLQMAALLPMAVSTDFSFEHAHAYGGSNLTIPIQHKFWELLGQGNAGCDNQLNII